MEVQEELKLPYLKDSRAKCYSVMITIPIMDYLRLVRKTYHDRGGIEGQRDVLKTSTAIRVRKRMIADLKKGAVLPPIVLGITLSQTDFDRLDNIDVYAFTEIIQSISTDNISIIDGMQRTAALSEVENEVDLSGREMRVEFWVAQNTNSLIYRMLVLNTGQIPWNLRRQIEVVFRAIIQEIKQKVPSITLLEAAGSNRGRRSQPCQFQADQIIELFLVFGSRKEKIDTKERLSDEFTKLDFMEATGERQFTEIFYKLLELLAQLDRVLGKYVAGESGEVTGQEEPQETENIRFKNGKDLFSSQPARIGLVAAIAQEVIGRPGVYHSEQEQRDRWDSIKDSADNLIARLEQMTPSDVGIFLDFNTLNEAITRRSGKIGDFEREFFLQAFKALVEEKFNLAQMTLCWRAY